MTASSLTVRLKREAKAHPGKAVVLALLAPVALYAWAPYVRQWFGGKEASDRAVVAKSATPTSGAAAVAKATPQVGGTMPEKPAPTRPRWDQIAQWMKHDPRRASVAEWRQRRNPFEPSDTHRKLVAEEEAAKQRAAQRKAGGEAEIKSASNPVAVTPTPQNCGLSVSSTLVGGRQALAVVHGPLVVAGQPVRQAVVREGETLLVAATATAGLSPAAGKKPAPGGAAKSAATTLDQPRALIPFRVVRITVDVVAFEHAGQTHELRVRSGKATGNVLMRSVATQ